MVSSEMTNIARCRPIIFLVSKLKKNINNLSVISKHQAQHTHSVPSDVLNPNLLIELAPNKSAEAQNTKSGQSPLVHFLPSSINTVVTLLLAVQMPGKSYFSPGRCRIQFLTIVLPSRGLDTNCVADVVSVSSYFFHFPVLFNSVLRIRYSSRISRQIYLAHTLVTYPQRESSQDVSHAFSDCSGNEMSRW